MAFLVYVYTYLLRKEESFLQAIPRTISRTLSRTFSRSSVRSRSSVASEKSVSMAGKPLVRGNSNLSVSASSYRRRRKIVYNPEVSKHTGSFYLRVGVIGFGIGSMIHSALTFGHYFEVSHLDSHCSGAIQAIKPLAHLCFTFVQMYFIFMNSKMCVHKYKTLAHFGLMHMSCTNICVWLRSIAVETLQVIKVDRRDTYNAMVKAYEEYKEDAEDDSDEKEPIQSLEEYMQGRLCLIGTMSEINCRWDAMLGKIVESSSVYLYPCIIQYSLICACVLYVMWSNVGDGNNGVKRTDSCSDVDTLDSDDDSEDENAHHKMSIDCAASSKGLFLGILLFVIAVVCIVCFYVLTTAHFIYIFDALFAGHVSEEIILVVAFFATAIAAFQMRQMRFSGHRTVGIEEILSLVSISGLGLYGIWSIIAAVFYLDTLHGRLTLITNLFMLIQAGAQATFTLATLRASARNHEQLREKPGRQCVTFLIICNFALWVVNTFETQRIEYNQTQVNFYGTTAWAIFSHISVPLGIYFRFNATVNLSIVWKKAWKKKETDGRNHTDVLHSSSHA
ncbi:unnamed protein product [Candidula unifasciata]|uniref:Otopetrin-2 n=1 Tax=Candidula unifasciata TaxID=100452 RepID=A0A8S3YSY8_9EUPU|nr:unnamed protein product [Candidula unifasciata]